MSSPATVSSDETFLADFHHVVAIGATDNNGVDRRALAPEGKQTCDWMQAWISRLTAIDWHNGFRVSGLS